MKAYIFNIQAQPTCIVWAYSYTDAVNKMFAAELIDENYTGSHGPKWSAEPLVAPACPMIVSGPIPGQGYCPHAPTLYNNSVTRMRDE